MAELKRKSPWDDPAPADLPPTTLRERMSDGRYEKVGEISPDALAAIQAANLVPVTIPVRRINFDVPVDLHREIRMKVASEGTTIADVGRRLLEEWLRKG